jgi:hypothetical protein
VSGILELESLARKHREQAAKAAVAKQRGCCLDEKEVHAPSTVGMKQIYRSRTVARFCPTVRRPSSPSAITTEPQQQVIRGNNNPQSILTALRQSRLYYTANARSLHKALVPVITGRLNLSNPIHITLESVLDLYQQVSVISKAFTVLNLLLHTILIRQLSFPDCTNLALFQPFLNRFFSIHQKINSHKGTNGLLVNCFSHYTLFSTDRPIDDFARRF